jgi:hypothetical protein
MHVINGFVVLRNVACSLHHRLRLCEEAIATLSRWSLQLPRAVGEASLIQHALVARLSFVARVPLRQARCAAVRFTCATRNQVPAQEYGHSRKGATSTRTAGSRDHAARHHQVAEEGRLVRIVAASILHGAKSAQTRASSSATPSRRPHDSEEEPFR